VVLGPLLEIVDAAIEFQRTPLVAMLLRAERIMNTAGTAANGRHRSARQPFVASFVD
jgi:hypothetical protein